MSEQRPRPAYGLWLLALAAAACTACAIGAYFRSESIGGTGGVLVVIGTSAAMLIATLAVALVRFLPRWLRGLLILLLLVDVLATGMAGWFLESQTMMGAMAAALLGWLLHVVAGPRSIRTARHARKETRTVA